ncbi:putative DNA-binding domain, KAT8 regulatory NSL complex subunit 2 [Helianthus annuus]|uniref:KAT8 regulatory NSL complex subunit 2 n=1 Tax=Helianthus annuus TaxID=4232 RepID=A0A251S306_HELAN|nr:INO80 complex subunit D [Helianthus annuus]KAF5759951.1 putative DNA-binding domain, KAT8 regulatory NSL complex subunit 2 [Helianthus annuus]KAJ0438075.1 putative DNA-binding domain, KAT8 regulatory NSL complex subunit 2 [Helianthus annuus]KAJ0460399.1 putative DNA-binding domain, KAT8 regulatory NSL complex subunit 2 [Helianthus annuus]
MSDSTARTAATSPSAMAAATELVDEDLFLSKSELLARDEVLKRRSRRLKQLARVYKDHYWCMMEELKLKYRKYYWEYGKSPYQENNESVVEIEGKNGDDSELGLGLEGVGGELTRCAVHGCKTKAMALTKFCHAHILSDSKQKLYMGCSYVIKSSQAGPIICGKPILKCTVPSLCTPHFQKAEKHVARALKKAGLNTSSTSKLAPKFHVIIAEYVRQIQSNRRIIEKEIKENLEVKEEDISI